MFTKPIFNTTFTGEIADRLFSNINCSSGLDRSFLATMRVLLRKRLPSDESACLVCKALRYSANDISAMTTVDCMSMFIPGETQYAIKNEHNIIIVNTTNQDTGAKMLEIVRANVGVGKRHTSNYSLQGDLRIFYARKLNALFYHSETDKNTVIFVDKLEHKQFHALQMMLPKYLPSLFKTNPLSESETALLKSLGNKSAVEYESLLEAFAADLDIRAEIIRTKLAGFETAFERIRRDELKTEIEKHQIAYQGYLYSLRDVTEEIQNCQYTLAGLESAIVEHEGDSELMEYFMCNKRLSIIKVTGTGIDFVSHGYADIYDQEAFDKYVRNKNGFMYSGLNPAVTKPQMEKLYRAIFGDGRFKLRLCAGFSADMKTGLHAKQHYAFPPESATFLPNPHIQHYGCIGNYAGRFQEYMQKKDGSSPNRVGN